MAVDPAALEALVQGVEGPDDVAAVLKATILRAYALKAHAVAACLALAGGSLLLFAGTVSAIAACLFALLGGPR